METNQLYRSYRSRIDKALILFLTLIVASCIALLSACTTPLRVSAERDRTVAFERYRTFAWLQPEQKDWQNNISARNQAELIQTAVTKELETRGMRVDTATPDLLLRYQSGIQNYTGYRTMPVYGYAPPIPFFFGRSLWYGGGGYYPMYSRSYRTNIREGTLNIEVIDRKTNNVIWRGLSEERLYSRGGMNADIPYIIQVIFEHYPLRPIVSAK